MSSECDIRQQGDGANPQPLPLTGGGVLAPGYVKDLRGLISDFIQDGSLSFQKFKNLWKSRGFSFIHEGTPRHVNPRRYLQILFSVALGFALPYRCTRRAHPAAQDRRSTGSCDNEVPPSTPAPTALDVASAAASVFSVYCLYCSQQPRPPTLIYVAPEELDALLVFAGDAGQLHQCWEAFLCLRRLEQECAFLYGAVPFRRRDVFGCTEEEAAAQREVAAKQLSVMREKLLGHFPVAEHFGTDLAAALGTEEADALGQDYEAALRALPNPPGPIQARGNGSTNSLPAVLFAEPSQLTTIVQQSRGQTCSTGKDKKWQNLGIK